MPNPRRVPPSPVVEEERREELAKIVARFMNAYPQPGNQVSPEIYVKAFDVAFDLNSVYSHVALLRDTADRIEATEFAVELLERAQKYLVLRELSVAGG